MKKWQTWLILLSTCWLLANQAVAVAEQFDPTWDSLSRQPLPQWLKDAKFGVYTHWGVYSVPAHGGPDYVRNLYEGCLLYTSDAADEVSPV